MFSGIISHTGTVVSHDMRGDLRLAIECDFARESYRMGESIACNGVCLTVVAYDDKGFTVELSAESVSRTAPRWKTGDKINLERSLKLGDALDGHIVSGHVDGIAVIENITVSGDSHILDIKAPQAMQKFIAEKGSVTLDGVALTVNSVNGDVFSVNIIPHTWKITTLSLRKAGDALNLEIDMLARYVARLMECK